MEKLALDSSVLIDFLRGGQKTRTLLLTLYERGYDIVLPSIVRFEVLVGIRSKIGAEAVKSFNTLPFDAKAADIAAEMQKKLIKSGKMPGIADLLIAATCIAHNAKIITRDRGFERFREHGLEIFSP